MVEHDGHVGQLLAKLEEHGILDNTIVIYSTDNGAETISWPDGGITPFHGEKGTTWEGGFRAPCVVRWPGVFEGGEKIQAIMSHEDWIPTLLAAAGKPNLVEDVKKGYEANGKTWKVHLDGFNFLPYFTAKSEKAPREQILYFGQGGELNAVRWNDWKVHFATLEGGINTAIRETPAWPLIINLKADPYEKMWEESKLGYLRWYADNMWLFVPIQQQVQGFLGTLDGYPFQPGSSLSAAGINYQSLKALKILEELQKSGYPVNR
jgi:arylsulfatase